ncbi:MAG: helix-turn-helix transcriptional regulator [bacterium]|jgi:transcriptional regulator with XRE-family HTH domain|nr:helix-turn-helix transcriptional regulator [bacterium]
MTPKTSTTLPAQRRLLQALGGRLRQARLRRRLTAQQVAERAGMSRTTLRALERGETSVTLGVFLNVLHVLGLDKDLTLVAQDEELGRRLQDAELRQRARPPASQARKDAGDAP